MTTNLAAELEALVGTRAVSAPARPDPALLSAEAPRRKQQPVRKQAKRGSKTNPEAEPEPLADTRAVSPEAPCSPAPVPLAEALSRKTALFPERAWCRTRC